MNVGVQAYLDKRVFFSCLKEDKKLHRKKVGVQLRKNRREVHRLMKGMFWTYPKNFKIIEFKRSLTSHVPHLRMKLVGNYARDLKLSSKIQRKFPLHLIKLKELAHWCCNGSSHRRKLKTHDICIVGGELNFDGSYGNWIFDKVFRSMSFSRCRKVFPLLAACSRNLFRNCSRSSPTSS